MIPAAGPAAVALVRRRRTAAVSLQYALFVMEESVEHRVTKAGYPAGTARATRREATADGPAEAASRYAECYRGSPPP